MNYETSKERVAVTNALANLEEVVLDRKSLTDILDATTMLRNAVEAEQAMWGWPLPPLGPRGVEFVAVTTAELIEGLDVTGAAELHERNAGATHWDDDEECDAAILAQEEQEDDDILEKAEEVMQRRALRDLQKRRGAEK